MKTKTDVKAGLFLGLGIVLGIGLILGGGGHGGGGCQPKHC